MFGYLDNRVSVDTNHFSTYMVVDKAKWHELWSRELDYSRNTSTPGIPTQYYDIVFAIDSSGSMSGNDPSGLRKEAAKQFVDAFYSEDQGAVVDFDSYAYIKVHLTQDRDAIKSAIDTINSSGGTNIDKAVNTSIDELLSSYANEENKKIIILLTDGSGTYYNNTTQRAIDNDITIYTVGLGYGVNSSLLDSIATSTGGQFYQAAESDELRDIFFGIEDETIGDGEIDTTDTDGDGLYDTYEIVGMKTPYGIVYSDPLLKDSDGDGLDDGEEMGSFSVTVSGGEIAYKGFYPLSLPDRKDSDGDGIEDTIDTSPLAVDKIPDVFLNYITEGIITFEDLEVAEDGFTLCTIPLPAMFDHYGISSLDDYSRDLSILFDDWYLYAINKSGEYVYSLVKLRFYNGTDAPSVAIPFREFNVDLLSDDESKYSQLSAELVNITSMPNGIEDDESIREYFEEENNETNYFIANVYINKVIANECIYNTISAKTFLERQRDQLMKHSNIYDEEKQVLTFEDINNLSLEEKQCLLVVRTGNPSLNSFAAEIIYHAVKTAEYHNMKNWWFGLDSGYNSAKKADMGAFEEKDDFTDNAYINYNGEYVKTQRNLFGDQ